MACCKPDKRNKENWALICVLTEGFLSSLRAREEVQLLQNENGKEPKNKSTLHNQLINFLTGLFRGELNTEGGCQNAIRVKLSWLW